MKFYEIAEPQPKEIAIGIDLGTTNSLVAVKVDGQVHIIMNLDGARLVPSVVLYSADGSVLVGSEAVGKAGSIMSVKRLMNKGIQDAHKSIAKLHSKSDECNIFLDIHGKAVSPIQVSAEILKVLKQQAENDLKQEIKKAVITVPAYFDDASRNATRTAAQLAGLEVLRLINEPTAAAVAYGLEKKENGKFLVYDLGGGTFDISILEKQDNVLQVVATAGDVNLGGEDFDLALLQLIKEKYHIENQPNEKILIAVKNFRETLTTETEVQGELWDTPISITRHEFESCVSDLVGDTLKLVRRALSDADLQIADIDEVILVGGVTRTPLIKARLFALFEKNPLDNINPDEIVAVGAAIQAYSLVNQDEDNALLLDVIPLSLGIELMGGVVERIIPRNSSIPIAVTKTFTNYSAEQTGIKLHIVQGEGDNVLQCRSLARLELNHMKKIQAGEAKIIVSFKVDADGILSVQAEEKNSQIKQELILKPSYGLDEEIILGLLRQ